MSIASEITRLDSAKASLKASINAKGGTLTAETLDQYYLAVDDLEDNYVRASNYPVLRIPPNKILKDATHLYSIGYLTSGKIVKIALSDMSTTYTGSVAGMKDMIENGDYLYTIATTYAYKYAKSDLSVVQQSTSYGGTVNAIATDGTYLYIGGATTQKIRKYALTDLTSLVAESSGLGGDIKYITYHNNLLYTYIGSYLYVYDTATLSLQATSTLLTTSLIKFTVSGDYIYFAEQPFLGGANIKRLDLATLNTYETLSMMGDGALGKIQDFVIADGLIYMVGTQENTTKYLAYSTCTTSLTGETAVQNKLKMVIDFTAIYVDTSYIYLGYSTSDAIIKIAKE